VKAVSCRKTLQTIIDRRGLSDQVAQPLGELLAGTLLMASGLKGEESLQVQMVGTGGVHSLMVVADAQLCARGRAGAVTLPVDDSRTPPPLSQPLSAEPTGNLVSPTLPLSTLLGEGELQVIHCHPTWKSPVHGLVPLQTTVSIATNLAVYLAQSEQRTAALIADVQVQNGLVKHCSAVLVERLPDAVDEHVEGAIANLERVRQLGLGTFFATARKELEATTASNDSNSDSNSSNGLLLSTFSDSEALHRIVDDCLQSMDANSFRYSKTPSFRCNCGLERVKTVLRALPRSEVQDIAKEEGIHVS
jgi:redox-regulated HSP33 family molecular chaperone